MTLTEFLTESNRIEGILRGPTPDELEAAEEFLDLYQVTVSSLEHLAKVFAGSELRRRPGMDVRIGRHRPIPGGPQVDEELSWLCDEINDDGNPHVVHIKFEILHPFSDGNGRVGRLIWLWMRQGHAPLGFLHQFYYDTLADASG